MGNRPLFFGEQGERPHTNTKVIVLRRTGRNPQKKYPKTKVIVLRRTGRNPQKNTKKILKQIASNMVKKHNFGAKQTWFDKRNFGVTKSSSSWYCSPMILQPSVSIALICRSISSWLVGGEKIYRLFIYLLFIYLFIYLSDLSSGTFLIQMNSLHQ